MKTTKTGRFGKAAACGVVVLGLAIGPLALGSSAAQTKKASAKAAAREEAPMPAPNFNPTDPILKCTAHDKGAASAFAVVQFPADLIDAASLNWEKSHPDTPACGLVSAEAATQFLRTTRNNPNWTAAAWQPSPQTLSAELNAANAAEAARPASKDELAQQAQDQAAAAAGKRDYVTALAMANKAAELGHPMDKDQVAFFTERATVQQRALDEAAKLKAAQQAAAGTAAQIMERQQKDYAERARRAALKAQDDEPSAAQMGMQGQALGAYAQSLGSAIAQNVKNGSLPTQANAVGSSTMARNLPTTTNGARPAGDCITLDKVKIDVDKSGNGPATVATNKCDFKVVFQWCAEGGQGDRSCPGGGALPTLREEVEAHGRVTLYQQTASLQVRTWACAAPGVPVSTAGAAYECR